VLKWECSEDLEETMERIPLAFLDFDEITQSLTSGGRISASDREKIDWLSARIPSWNSPTQELAEPIHFGFECNWRDAETTWWRSIHLVRSGRHRLLAAHESGIVSVWGFVGQRLFCPAGLRPQDRIAVPASGQLAEPKPRDHAHRKRAAVAPVLP
jgi:hypothetical protein